MHGDRDRRRDRGADHIAHVAARDELADQHTRGCDRHDDDEQQLQQAPPHEEVSRPDELQRTIDVTRGKHGGIAELDEGRVLGVGRLATALDVGVDGVADSLAQLAAELVAL
jgi:hypothetical protein